jgi:tRNA(fMet)-specific endonuclease VapC
VVTSARFLLDTDILSYARKRQHPQITRRFERLHFGEAVLSVVTFGELLFGAHQSVNRAKAVQDLERLIQVIPVAPLPANAAHEYAVLRLELTKSGTLIGNNDLWIAAHALAEDLILVTNNEREYKRVRGLKLENWAK